MNVRRGIAAAAVTAVACVGLGVTPATAAGLPTLPPTPSSLSTAIPSLLPLPTTPPTSVPTAPPTALPSTPPLPTGTPSTPSSLPSLNGIPSAAASALPGGGPTVTLPSNGATPTGSGLPDGSSASGSALDLAPIDTCIACTGAAAGPDAGPSGAGAGSSSASSVRVLGTTLVGGSSNGGSGSGSLVTIAQNPFLSVAIAEWSSAMEAAHGSSAAHSRASLFDMSLGGGHVATIALLESFSDATWTPSGSSASGGTNAVHADVLNGAIGVVLLHSGSSTNGPSTVYLVSLDGTLAPQKAVAGRTATRQVPNIASVVMLQTASGDQWTSSSILDVTNTIPMMLGTGETGMVLASQANRSAARSAGGGTGAGGTGSGAGGGSSGNGAGGISGAPGSSGTPAVSGNAAPATGSTGGVGGTLVYGAGGSAARAGDASSMATVAANRGLIPGLFETLSTPLTGAGMRLWGLIIAMGGFLVLVVARRSSREKEQARSALARVARL